MSEMIIETSTVIPVVVLGIFGNVLVVHVLLANPHMRTPTNLLIGNMAVADLLSLLIHPWVILTYDFFQNYKLGPVGCRGEAAIECSILIASVISMSAITYDRLTAIVLPKETRLNKRSAKIVMAVTWIVGILMAIPITYFRKYKERQWLNFLEKYCTENLVVINIYWYVIIAVLVWVPLSIQIICYISIFIKLNKYEKAVLKTLQHHHVCYKKRAAKTMFIVTLTFMVCRLPFTVLIIYRHQLIQMKKLGVAFDVKSQVNGVYHTLWFISKYLIYVNASVNPVIFGATNEKFRKAFKTTRLSKWMFPPSGKTATKINGHIKATQDSTSKYSIFVLFKRKLKIQENADKNVVPESTDYFVFK